MNLSAAAPRVVVGTLFALALALVLCGKPAGAREPIDIVVLTFQPELMPLLIDQLDSRKTSSEASRRPKWITGTIQPRHYKAPYRLALVSADGNVETRNAAATVLERWQPRFFLLASTAVDLQGKLRPGDIMVSRLIWRYRYENEILSYDPSESFRSSGALVTAASTWPPGKPGLSLQGARRAVVKTGAVASGNRADARDGKLVAEILRHNARTLFADTESAAIASAIANARDRGTVTGFAAIAANRSEPDRGLAPTAVTRFIGTLVRERWPAAPMVTGRKP